MPKSHRTRKADPDKDRPARAGTIALLGRPNVGKSTLLNALMGEQLAIVSHHPQTTRDRIAGIVTRGLAQFVFVDTPGLHRPRTKLGKRMNELASLAAEDSDVIMFMTDGGVRGEVEPSICEDDRAILASIPEKKPALLLLNKIDRVTPRSRLFPLLEAYGKLRDFAAIIPVSALKADGVERIFFEIEKLLPEGEHLYGDDEMSDKPVRFFVAEFVREQILRRTRQEVPHGVAVTVESFDESPRIVHIAVTVHVAKDSHKAIVIGDGGKMLAAIGTAARKRAEQMIGRKVHLETWIRATPRWFDDPARLVDLGYADGAKTTRGST
ncbi:MAG: GTPase Era [Polyangiaceae bacterium]|nr:GTPase Era [Polyangiaceae bacterium]